MDKGIPTDTVAPAEDDVPLAENIQISDTLATEGGVAVEVVPMEGEVPAAATTPTEEEIVVVVVLMEEEISATATMPTKEENPTVSCPPADGVTPEEQQVKNSATNPASEL